MPQSCRICNHPERLQIDREIIDGKSKSGIASRHGVPAHSVSYHAENHLSRQLTQAYEKRSLAESADLMGRIDKIIDRAEQIFSRNYERDTATGDLTALKALGEQRCTIELLAKISAYLHEARLLELQSNRDHLQQEREAEYSEQLKRLTLEELDVLQYLQAKMEGEEIEEWLVPDMFKAPIPVPRQAQPPLPPPRPPAPVVADTPKPEREEAALEDPAPEEPEQEKPRGLPLAPSREIPGGGRGMRLKRHLLGKKVYDGLLER